MYLLKIEKKFPQNKDVPEYKEFETWLEMSKYLFEKAMFIQSYEVKELKEVETPKEKYDPSKIYVSHPYI